MKLFYTIFFSFILLMIVHPGKAQISYCDCPTDTIFTNLNGVLFFPSEHPDIPSPNKELLQACDEGTINLLNLICTFILLPDANKAESQNSNSLACITDDNIQFSGNGVDGYCFDPMEAGVGIHDICFCADNSSCPDVRSSFNSQNSSECSMGSNYTCCQFQIVVIDANLDFGVNDPCSCDDPLNVQEPGQPVTLFHDLLTFEGVPLDHTVVIFGFEGFRDPVYLTSNPMGITLGDELNIIIAENMDGLYQLDIWRLPSSTFAIDWRVIRNSDNVVVFETDDEEPFELCLDEDACPGIAPIPTMGTWMLLILGLLFVIGGVIAMRRKSLAF